MSDLSKLLTVAHLSWATWVILSQSLISSERPEWFAHGHSFVLSDLIKSLTVAHLIWAKWADERMSEWVNEQMSDEQMSEWAMSEWANSQPWIDLVSSVPWGQLKLNSLFILKERYHERVTLIFTQECLFYSHITL